MSSITFWNRLEPSPSDGTVGRSLAAEVRDPVWLLARQWQLGEFRGEDAGSIARVELATATVIDGAWGPADGEASRPLLATNGSGEWFPSAPIERAVMGESAADADDLSLAVELGQRFEALVRERLDPSVAAAIVDAVRVGFALPAPDAPGLDVPARRFLRVCAGRSPDGVGVFLAAAGGVFWSKVALAPPDGGRVAVERVLGDFVAGVRAAWGDLDASAPPAWRGRSLRYDARVVDASRPAALRLRAHPDGRGELDWYHFDAEAPPGAFTGATNVRELIPGHVRFRGMPEVRWWDFESSPSDFGAMTLDRRDLGRLAVMEFMLSQGNDWFVIPYPMHVGTACRVTSLRVCDVFGGVTEAPRADALAPGWSMYGTSRAGDPEGPPCDFFHLPASASMSALHGAAVEALRCLRDESANLAWAVSQAAPDRLGEPRPAREQAELAAPSTEPPAPPGEAAPRYVVQADVPAWWAPLVPTQPADGGPVTLRLGGFVTSRQGLTPPRGRLVPREVDEAAVPRVGVTLSRVRVASRWIDGSLHVWGQRLRAVGAGEGSSGLRFDALAEGRSSEGEATRA